jgi:hypothetical protein
MKSNDENGGVGECIVLGMIFISVALGFIYRLAFGFLVFGTFLIALALIQVFGNIYLKLKDSQSKGDGSDD